MAAVPECSCCKLPVLMCHELSPGVGTISSSCARRPAGRRRGALLDDSSNQDWQSYLYAKSTVPRQRRGSRNPGWTYRVRQRIPVKSL